MLGFKTIAAVVLACVFFTGCLEFFQQPAQPSPAPQPVISAATPSPTPALAVITPTPTPAAREKQVEAQEKQVEVEFKEIEPSGCLSPTDKQVLSEVTPVQGGVRVRQGFLTSDPCWNVATRAALKQNVVSLFINASRDPGVVCIQCIAIKTIEANLRLAPGSYFLKIFLERDGETKVLKEASVVVQ